MKSLLTFLTAILVSNLLNAQCLEAYYPFKGNAADSSGNGHDATVHGATMTTDRFGNPNSAYEFDGFDDFIDTKTSFDYQDRTVSVWCMVYDTASDRKVLDQDDIALNYGAFSVVFRGGHLYGNAGGHGGVLLQTAPNLNQWYHIVLVRNALSAMIYVNGNLVYTGTPTGSGSLTFPNPELVIGAWRNRQERFFSGKIDDVKVYSCELSSSAIESLFTGVEELIDIDLKLFPNPMKDFVIMEFNNAQGRTYTLTLADQWGRLVRTVDNIRGNQVRIDRNELANGIYFFQLQTTDQTAATGKIIIE